jgi:acyl-CoA synthetase (AMP-forming)/AMP-acid ligase II
VRNAGATVDFVHIESLVPPSRVEFAEARSPSGGLVTIDRTQMWGALTCAERGGVIADPHERADVRDVVARAERAASTIGRGEGRVAVLAPSGVPFLVALFGAWRARRTVVVLSTLHPLAETTYFCDHAEVDVVVFADELREQAVALATSTSGRSRRLVPTSSLEEGAPMRGDGPRADDDALVLYTSGTTSRPKGARLTHGNLAVQAGVLREAWAWSPRDRLVHALPLHHLHGLHIALLTAILAGASVDVIPKFDAHAMLDALAGPPSSSRDATSPVLMAVPTMLRRLVQAFDAADAGALLALARLAPTDDERFGGARDTHRRAMARAHGRGPARALRHDRDRRRHVDATRSAARARQRGLGARHGRGARRRRGGARAPGRARRRAADPRS